VRAVRDFRQPILFVGLCALGGGLVVAGLTAFFRGSSGDLYPVSDQAILEIYTLHAVRGFWTLGPYSQFGWHHPGPLYFYLLAPWYALSGHKTIALHVGAFVINLLSLCGMAYVLVRQTAPLVACLAALGLGVYVSRLEPVLTSYWNPHIVILPSTLYLLLCVAVAGRKGPALPFAVIVGSFLIQTHISLAPYVLVLGVAAVAAGGRPVAGQQPERAPLRALLLPLGLVAVLWLPPIVEQMTHSPGNLTRTLQFFEAPSAGQDWRTAVAVWSDMTCAVFRKQLVLPEGGLLQPTPDSVTVTAAFAQLLLLAAGWLDAYRRGDRSMSALAAAGVLSSLVALWSISRVPSLVGDYTIFWLSAVGALNWAVVAGLVFARLAGERLPVLQQAVAVGTSALVVWFSADAGVGQIKRERRQALRPPRDSARVVQLATAAILDDMQRAGARRPLFHLATSDWTTAAGVLLQVYKRRVPPAVDPGLVSWFGEPFAADGREDRVFVVTDPAARAKLAQVPDGELLTGVERFYIYASRLPSAPR